MRSILLFSSICLLCLFQMACGNSATKDSPVAILTEEVMAIHDEVMPKMGEMTQLQKKLTKELKKLQETPSPDLDKVAAIKQSISKLKNANEGMMQWMRDYDHPDPEQEQKALDYLNAEKEKVEQVKADMLSSMEEAQQLLQQ